MFPQESDDPNVTRNSLSPKHNILFSIPRTASNLVIRLLSLQEQSSVLPHPHDGYFFLPALRYRYKHSLSASSIEAWPESIDKGYHSALQEGMDAWHGWMNEVELAGRGSFIKEHINWTVTPEAERMFRGGAKADDKHHDVPFNPTCLSTDILLRRVKVTFLIRHPALTFPSLFRAAIDNEGLEAVLTSSARATFKWEATYRWHIELYKFLLASSPTNDTYTEESNHAPIILDASDLSSVELVRKYAQTVGLNAESVQFEWKPTSEEQKAGIPKVEARMKDTLLESEGVITTKLVRFEEGKLQEEKRSWLAEFGDSLGDLLATLVDNGMDDYRWLWNRRLQT